jgi:hypothetical protein
MPVYRVSGIGIASEIPLPELPEAAAGIPTDASIRLGPVEGRPPSMAPGRSVFRVSPGDVGLWWPGVAAVTIRGGREVVLDPEAGAGESLVRSFLLGPGLAVLLHQRGRLVLHASAMVRGGRAVAVLGNSGDGKSTTCAALHARGFSVLTDDTLVVDPDGSPAPLAYPGLPRIRMSAEAARRLGHRPEDLPPVDEARDPRRQLAPEPPPDRSVPLARLYVLADDERFGVDPLPPQQQVMALVTNSFCIRLVPATGPDRHLAQCGRVAAACPPRRLRRPRDLDRLPELAALVEADAGL